MTYAKWPGWTLIAPLMVVGVASARWISESLPSCLFHKQTGLLCPGCGATRSALALGEGRIVEAVQLNALFVLMVLGGGIWILLSGAQVRYPQVGWLRIFRWRIGFLWAALVLVAAFGILRNTPWI